MNDYCKQTFIRVREILRRFFVANISHREVVFALWVLFQNECGLSMVAKNSRGKPVYFRQITK